MKVATEEGISEEMTEGQKGEVSQGLVPGKRESENLSELASVQSQISTSRSRRSNVSAGNKRKKTVITHSREKKLKYEKERSKSKLN